MNWIRIFKKYKTKLKKKLLRVYLVFLSCASFLKIVFIVYCFMSEIITPAFLAAFTLDSVIHHYNLFYLIYAFLCTLILSVLFLINPYIGQYEELYYATKKHLKKNHILKENDKYIYGSLILFAVQLFLTLTSIYSILKFYFKYKDL